MTDYVINHQMEFWLGFGFIMLSLEIVTGFSTGIFLFGGLAALATGVLMSFGVLPQTWVAGVSSAGIGSGLITLLLWKPLKKLQGSGPAKKDNSSDLVGHKFILDSDVSVSNPGVTVYSGVTWRVEIDEDAEADTLAAGQRVSVSSVEVGLFKVRAA
ncbi:MAG: hypothetical protein ACI8Z1_003082 [Candidatus Azotimanducaceae bacterium]|jgi:membrane protein implicated in regulation of membrane protease activity